MLLLCLVAPLGVEAVDPPHYDPASGFTCANCHITQLTLGSTGYNNVCLNCHRPGNPAAGSNPFTLADAADPFQTHTSAVGPRRYQTSHRWDGPDTVPQAGALPPIQDQLTTSTLRQRSGNQLACVRCHNQHYNTYGKFLRVPNDQDQLCLDCHRIRNVASHLKGSHPIGVSYDAAAAAKPGAFNTPPRNANPANPSSDLNARLTASGGAVLCSTCHGVHYSDSRSSTADGAANFANLSTADGYLLRTDPRGAAAASGQPDGVNLCTNCHAGKRNHNFRGQDIQCLDCHGAHVEYDPNDPTGSKGTNVFLVRRNPVRAGAGQVFFRYTGSRREYVNAQGTGVCQGCHSVPPPGGIYPPQHASSDPKVCNTCHFHNNPVGSFSGSCAACHGFPPVSTAIGGASGLATPATGALGASPASAGAHAVHVTTRGMGCNACHDGYTAKAMPSSSIDMGFSVNAGSFPGFTGSVTGGTLAGNSALTGYTWSGAPGTTVTGVANATTSCAVYCHGSTLTGGSTPTPSWIGGASQAACGTCHGASAAAPPTSGGHLRHAGSGTGGLGLACAQCHANPGAPGHLNGSVSWDVSALPAQGGAPLYRGAAAGSSAGPAPSQSYGQCSNVYCHGGKSVTWGGPALPADCSGCHGGLATGPDYANGTPKANSHAKHVAVNGLACNLCHANVVDASGAIVNRALHANQRYEVAPGGSASFGVTVAGSAGTPTQCSNISCHGGTGSAATWGQALNCQDCHTASADLDNFGASFWNNGIVGKIGSGEWTSTGHGASAPYRSGNPGANFGRNGNLRQCEFCHDPGVGHKLAGNAFRLLSYSSAAWGRNQVCQSCHASGSAGVSVAGVLIGSTLKIDSAHLGAKHGSANSGGQFCWDCHDAHGDANDYMLHAQVARSSDRATGAPTATVAVGFTLATPGATTWGDFVKPGPAFNGICQVCHTATGAAAVAHFTASSYDANHNPGGSCTACHGHTGLTATTAFEPRGSCNSCHGYPPAPRKVASAVTFGVQGSWSSARFEDYSGGGGAHLVAGHIAKSAQPSQGWANCLPCHNRGPAAHATTQPLRSHVENVTVQVAPQYRFSGDLQATYTSAKLLSGGANTSGGCFNVSCHFSPSPKWSIER